MIFLTNYSNDSFVITENYTFEGTWFESYIVFDISKLRDIFNLQLERYIDIVNQVVLRIGRTYDPLLVLFENISYNPLFEGTERLTRSVDSGDHWPYTEGIVSESYTAAHCQRYDWQLYMTFFNWHWYIYPDTYNADFCKGSCVPIDSDVLNLTNYSYMKGLFHYMMGNTEEVVPRECCTPIAYAPETIMYYDENLDVAMKTLPNMKVTACGCR